MGLMDWNVHIFFPDDGFNFGNDSIQYFIRPPTPRSAEKKKHDDLPHKRNCLGSQTQKLLIEY